jgi:hypothetical protein
MPTTIAVASPTVGFPVMGAEGRFLAVISNRDLNVITIFSLVGLLMATLFAVYLGPLDDPAALLIQTSKASVTSAVTPRRPAPNAVGVVRADDQPLMATGLDLNGPAKRFPAKEMLGNLEIPGF